MNTPREHLVRRDWKRIAAYASVLEKLALGLMLSGLLAGFPRATFFLALACIAMLWSSSLRIRELNEYERDYKEEQSRREKKIESLLRGDDGP